MLALEPSRTALVHQPLPVLPSLSDWHALQRWTQAHPPRDPRRGRPSAPTWGSTPEWIRLPVETLTRSRWTVTWDPEAGIIGTRWIPIPRQRPNHLFWQVVLGPADWIGVWTVQLASDAAPYSVWSVWWPAWHRVVPVVLLDRADPEPYGPHPPMIDGRIVATADQRDRWAAFVGDRGWVTPDEWRYWTAPTDRLTAVMHWPVVLW
ncbi:MAG: hypothetical protein OWQ57_03875 [Sulfobacillus sp.]|nr:hypothetical protein [Sulfobacillus sp.]